MLKYEEIKLYKKRAFMIIKKYPLQLLFIQSMICLIAVIFISHGFSNPSAPTTPFYLTIVFVYSFLSKKPIDYCKSQKSNNKTLYVGCYIIVLGFTAILMWYLGYVGELNVQKYINANK